MTALLLWRIIMGEVVLFRDEDLTYEEAAPIDFYDDEEEELLLKRQMLDELWELKRKD